MLQKAHIKSAIKCIEDNIEDEFNIDKVSRLSCVSSMQLYRDFYSMTGHSVKEYIRKRRLSMALTLVKHTRMSLIDIAYACGYSSQQAFCKCVKLATGLTPIEYKNSDCFYYFPRFNMNFNRQISVSSESIPQTILCRYYHSQIRGIENRAVNYLLSVLPGFGNRIFGRNGKQLGNKFCYELYIEYSASDYESLLKSDFSGCIIIPSYKECFAITSAKNFDQEINSAWDYLYTYWLKTSMFEQSEKPYFEEYIMKNNKVKKLLLYLPVKKRIDYNKITINTCDEMTFLVSEKSGKNAEEIASRKVMNFIASNYPYLVRTMNTFLISRHSGKYVCGIRLNKELNLPKLSDLEIISVESGRYAILESECCGDSSIYESLLLSWVSDNGFVREGSVFALYEANGGFEQENIKTKIYVKLKM